MPSEDMPGMVRSHASGSADDAARLLGRLGLSDVSSHPEASPRRFPDGGWYRVEIPSVEGPAALEAVLEEAEGLGVTVHRVSQGSGVMMLSDREIRRMVDLCGSAEIELCLFLGPRASWDIGGARFSRSGGSVGRARGRDQLAQCLMEARRATELGVPCLLVADEGVLWALHQLREEGELPAEMTLKVSVLAAPANPMAFRLLELLGADSINVPADLTISQVGELRASGGAAVDFYIEAPDDLGGFVRMYDMPELIRVGAPMYVKFGLRNAGDLYPVGKHLAGLAVRSASERVRRAHLALELLERVGTDTTMSPRGARAIGPLARLGTAPVETPR